MTYLARSERPVVVATASSTRAAPLTAPRWVEPSPERSSLLVGGRRKAEGGRRVPPSAQLARAGEVEQPVDERGHGGGAGNGEQPRDHDVAGNTPPDRRESLCRANAHHRAVEHV